MMNYQDGTIVAFEDHTNDHNCTDVMFALKPQFGINDNDNRIEKLDTTTTSYTASNVFAFEDMWPSEGDYDMNDVLVYTTYGKTTEIDVTKSSKYHTISEDFMFETDQNHSNRTALNNGLAAWIDSTGLSLTVSVKASGATEYTKLDASKYTVKEENNKTYIYLDSNVKKDMGATYKVTVDYGYAAGKSANKQTSYGCFLYRDDAGDKGRWEMHIPYEEPTSLLSEYYKAYLVSGKPYAAVTKDNNVFFPFAIKLAAAAKDKLTKLTNSGNETKRIDALYTNYSNWAKSEGKDNTNWYNE
jgi:LruC domain-containing protein